MPLAGQALPAAGREGLKWGCLALFKASVALNSARRQTAKKMRKAVPLAALAGFRRPGAPCPRRHARTGPASEAMLECEHTRWRVQQPFSECGGGLGGRRVTRMARRTPFCARARRRPAPARGRLSALRVRRFKCDALSSRHVTGVVPALPPAGRSTFPGCAGERATGRMRERLNGRRARCCYTPRAPHHHRWHRRGAVRTTGGENRTEK